MIVFFKKIILILLVLPHLTLAQNLEAEINKANNYIDEALFNGIIRSYLVSRLDILNKIRKKKSIVYFAETNSTRHVRILDFDIEKFEDLNCDYKSTKFYDCIKATPREGIMSFFTVKDAEWHYIESDFFGFRVFLDKFPKNFSSRNVQFPNLNEFLKDVKGNIFLCLGYFCIYENNQLLAYTGEQGFKELRILLYS